jgi:RNA polymerase sigma factor (TIGR02999 family)
MSDVTQILGQIEDGDGQAAEKLLPLVYDELRKLAAAKMAQEAPGQTLQATAPVHEAYIRLVDVEKAQHWESRGHFFSAAAEAMRRILVEQARRKQRIRHGGALLRISLDEVDLVDTGSCEDILALDVALTQLASEEPMVAKVVNLRYFTGFTIDETASALGISVRTANRHWAYAKAWLFQQLAN